MLRLFILLTLWISLFSAEVEQHRWKNGEMFLSFLEKNNLPLRDLYYNLDRDDQILTTEMHTGIHYQILRDDDGKIAQILLPLNSDLQIHIYKNKDSYNFEVIPIVLKKKIEALTLTITSSPNYNILKETGSNKLAKIFISAFRNSLNFKNNIRKGDKLVMIYQQLYRLGNRFSMPTLQTAMIEMRGKKHFIYLNKDDRYYDHNGHRARGFLLNAPVKGARISSYFTKRRFHPILKRWKAHLGVDFAVRRGTPIAASGSGKVTFAGRNGAYGNLVKLRHSDGYETRYAHMKSFRNGIRRGSYVKKGQVIGYVGSTGRSTGPHLHFELRKNGNAIDPLKVVRVSTKKLKGKEKKQFFELRDQYNEDIDHHLFNETKFKKFKKIERKCYFLNLK
ncbi:MAG: peptidoglycan DD-metalloendopeptidase family protein [Campylobacterota bacterium]|nr:peptidoglycan DD-metalloendopeptidase family protein [Campylobacterota bacterium]